MELQQQLASLIEDARKAGSGAYEYLMAHAPELANQIVLWDRWYSGMMAAVFIAMATTLFMLAKKIAKKGDGFWHDDDMTGAAVLLIISLVAGIIGISYSFDLVKTFVAPWLVVMEEVKSILR